MRFFTDLLSDLEANSNVVLTTDFNCICEADKADSGVYADSSGKVLLGIMNKHFLIDVAKLKTSADMLKFTSFEGSSHARLDSIYGPVSLATHMS